MREIRALVASGSRRCVVAARFGVSVRTVSFIVNRVTWGWVQDAPAPARRGLTERELMRFWAKVDVRGPTDCWPWTAGLTTDGYGRFRREGGSPVCQAHRVAWEATHGEIPAGLCVWHSCADGLCVNPLHLYLATRAEHNGDMAEEGRLRRGEGCWQAKLNEEQVLAIRARVVVGESQAALGRAFGVSSAAVRKIVNRTNWAWLEEGG